MKLTQTGRPKRTNMRDEDYLAAIEEFREWCERRRLPYRKVMPLALRAYMDMGKRLAEMEGGE